MKKMKLSVVIPTINRREYLSVVLEELMPLVNEIGLDISISANFCTDDTHDYLKGLELSPNGVKVTYHNVLLSIDENMISAIEMADGDYIFPLGDDDYITKESIFEIIALINNSNHDLILLNGFHTDESLNYIRDHLPKELLEITITEPDVAFEKLWNYMPFGSFLAKKDSFNLNQSVKYLGTSHAYTGIVWHALADKYNQKSDLSIYCMGKKTVHLRGALKSWVSNKSMILYYEIPLWFNLIATINIYRNVSFKSLINYEKSITSIRSLLWNYFSSKDYILIKSLPSLNVCFFNRVLVSFISILPRKFCFRVLMFVKRICS